MGLGAVVFCALVVLGMYYIPKNRVVASQEMTRCNNTPMY